MRKCFYTCQSSSCGHLLSQKENKEIGNQSPSSPKGTFTFRALVTELTTQGTSLLLQLPGTRRVGLTSHSLPCQFPHLCLGVFSPLQNLKISQLSQLLNLPLPPQEKELAITLPLHKAGVRCHVHRYSLSCWVASSIQDI